MIRFVFSFVLCVWSGLLFGQYYIYGGYNFGALQLDGTNNAVAEFNTAENHTLGLLQNNFHGFRVGAGRYVKHAVVELAYGNLIGQQSSFNPDQLKERAEVVVNYASVSARAGVKPFAKQFFTVGAALHLGAQRYRYSFGGDYQTPIDRYLIAPEVYLDYAIRLKFLLKKSQRDTYFYLLRIRPYYQWHSNRSVESFSQSLNQTPALVEDNMSHFGCTVSLVIPFISDAERAYLFHPKKRRSPSTDPKGRL